MQKDLREWEKGWQEEQGKLAQDDSQIAGVNSKKFKDYCVKWAEGITQTSIGLVVAHVIIVSSQSQLDLDLDFGLLWVWVWVWV